MNRVIVLLALGLVMFIGLMVFNGGDNEPDQKVQNQAQKPPSEKAEITEAERDDYVNTIKTINARAVSLEKQMQAMQAKIDEQNKSALSRQDVEVIAQRSSEQRAQDFKSVMDDKFKEFSSVIDEVKGKKVGNVPAGLGLDQIVGRMNAQEDNPGASHTLDGLGIPGQGDRYVTITPLVTVNAIQSRTGSGADVKMLPDGTPMGSGNTDSLATGGSGRGVPQRDPPVPMYTIPQNATLFENASMTALLGIVPVNGQVLDPVRFKLITGPENIATNGLYLPPGIKNIVWSGIALGNREMACTYGQLNSVTFTFEDGRVTTINSQTDAGQDKLGGKMLGYIATKSGNPCVPGQLISNASQYLKDRMWASGFGSAAQAFSDTQQQTLITPDGGVVESFNGDTADYITGSTLAGSLQELVQYLRDRQAQAIDLVYVPSGQEFVLHVEKEIRIDYDPNGRKLDHANQIPVPEMASAAGALD